MKIIRVLFEVSLAANFYDNKNRLIAPNIIPITCLLSRFSSNK